MATPLAHRKNAPPEWSVERAIQFYNIDGWGSGYFSVNEAGHLTATPYGQPGPAIDLTDIILDVQEKGLGFPCVIRIMDILRARVVRLNETFRRVMKESGYTGQYYGVFPVKVNQMREVVEEILDAGAPFHYGLEAGSKPELYPALALNTDPEALTVCNGYKDEDYMRLALIGRKLGRKIVVVVEKLSELNLLLKVSEEMQVQPLIGLRAKLTTRGSGKWQHSAGDFAKFGLTIPEIIECVRILREAGKLDQLKLFHFHVGSQLTDIHTVNEATREGARVYAKLRKMGCPIEYFDVGGGLGVDYVGSRTTSNSSTNYGLEEYVTDIVTNLQQICGDEEVPEPHVVTESGRAITAHHSCIIMNVFGNIEIGERPAAQKVAAPSPDEAELVAQMRKLVATVNKKNALAVYHSAQAKRDEALQSFRLGILGLEERATVETLFWELARNIAKMTADMKHVPQDLRGLSTQLADQYLGNFSLFQSALDNWAFDQVFPVMPIQRLTEAPTREATIVDITCDSDGEIDQFVGADGVRPTLAVHDLRPEEPYFIGMFLTGAYQDIMGDMHNLFGRTNEVHVFVDDEDPEDFYLETVLPGDVISDVLSRVQYEPRELVKRVKAVADQRVKDGHLKPKEGVSIVEFMEARLRSYTYLRATVAGGEPLSQGALEAMKAAATAGTTQPPNGNPPAGNP